MVQLRKPRLEAGSTRFGTPDQARNHTIRPCDGCNTWGWCGRHSCCWRLEQADIRAERARGARGVQTGDDPRGSNRI